MPHRNAQVTEGERQPVPVPGPDSSFAERLNYLFDTLRPRDGDPSKVNARTGEFSNAYVAETVSGYGDGTITAAYIRKLRGPVATDNDADDPGEDRDKKRGNPSIRIARLLARFFNVPAGYFVEDDVTARIVQQFTLVQQLHDQGVKNLAMRAADLSPASKEALLKMVDAARAMEGLTDSPDAVT
ncbi:hypothetical protein [Streptomyces coeruleorubidus]|uniref:hypothetical protein n=1 Tax=Streptomyces coeruleorubidus TaxID=116188 RepID=UPI0033BA59AC